MNDFSDFSEGHFVGNLEGILRDFFGTHKIKAQTFRRKFRSIFRKFVAPKKSFVPKFALQTCHPNETVFGPFPKRGPQRAQRSKKFDLDRNFQSRSTRCLDFPTKKKGPRWVARSKISFLDRNFQSRSKSRICLIFGPSGSLGARVICTEIPGEIPRGQGWSSGRSSSDTLAMVRYFQR